MHTNGIHPDGASLDETPARSATILRGSYFLDRALVALASILTTIGIAFGAFHGIGLRASVAARVDAILRNTYYLDPAYPERLRYRVMDRAYPFDPAAPISEQFAQFTVNVLTWLPVTATLLGCGLLAVAARCHAD